MDKPILFSGPMVRAILEGRKTVTRRVLKQPGEMGVRGAPVTVDNYHTGKPEAGLAYYWKERGCWNSSQPIKLAHAVGDRLYVKEATWFWCERVPNGTTPTGRQKWRYVPMRETAPVYCVDHPDKPLVSVVSPNTGNQWGWRYKVGRFMPRWASRITLEVTGVKVERLQDISEEDAKAEGCAPTTCANVLSPQDGFPSFRSAFAILWQSINGPGSWDANPWVAAYSFRVVPTSHREGK